MKKILAVLLAISLMFAFTACDLLKQNPSNAPGSSNGSSNDGGQSGGSNTDNNGGSQNAGGGSSNDGGYKTIGKVDPTDPSVYTLDCMTSMGMWETPKSNKDVDAAAKKMLKNIENNPDTLKPKSGGKYVYVSNDGKDASGYGTTASKPVATIAYANSIAKSGDVVVLNRGDFWRERIVGKAGVSYGAYGKGNKPTLYGSPENLAEREWKKTATKDVYSVAIGATNNIGALVFDHGVAVASLKANASAVKDNYDFYISGAKVYVYCKEGNPGEMYANIEICSGDHIIRLASNSTVQNLRLMYTGIHGISMGTVSNVEVDGCVVGYIGGGKSGAGARLGNGIEVYGGCDGYTIKNCHVFQCYDAGVTFQFDGSREEKNILFENNLLEYSVYNIEYFMGGKDGVMKDVLIQGNIMRFGGYGWGYHTRPDKGRGTNFEGRGMQNRTENFVVKNNTFDLSQSFLREISAKEDAWLPTFTGNTYYQLDKTRVARIQDMDYGLKRYGEEIITQFLGDKTGKLVVYK